MKIAISFIDIIGVIKWFLKPVLFRSPYFGRNFDDFDWDNVSALGEIWCWQGVAWEVWCWCISGGQ